MAGDVLRELLDVHDVRVLRSGEGIFLLGLHKVEVGLVWILALFLSLVDT